MSAFDDGEPYPTQTRAPAESVSGGNPFGGGDGFADEPVARDTSVSVSLPPNHHQQAPITPPASTNPFALAAAASASSGSPSGLEDVAAPAAGASLAITYPALGEEAVEFAESIKHGRIVVGEPELRAGKPAFLTHHVYRVSCASGSVEHVFRRFSDFVWLRSVLSKAFTGVFVAPLPPKQILGNKEDGFVESRRQDLQRWLGRVVSRPFFAEHPAMDLFLQRATAAFEQDQKEMTKQVENTPLSEQATRLADIFPEIARQPSAVGPNGEADPNGETAMEALRDFLAVSELKVGQLVGATEKFVSVNHSGVSELARLTTAFQAAQEVEKVFVHERLPASMRSQGIAPRVDVHDALVAWQHALKWSSNAHDALLLAPLRCEHQDLVAMQEALKQRADLSARFTKSLARLAKWSLPANTPKNEKQSAAKLVDEGIVRDEGALLAIATKILLHSGFEQSWTFRMTQFRTRLHRFARTQMDAAKQLHDTWANVAAATTD